MRRLPVRRSPDPAWSSTVLWSPHWLALATEIRHMADAAPSPDSQLALRELALRFTALAAGLDGFTDQSIRS